MEIIFWSPSGEELQSPVFDFIDSEPPKNKKRIMSVLDLFSKQGMNLLQTQFLEKVKPHKLFALRIKCSQVTYRILLSIKSGSAVLLHSFKKKTNKIPDKEIKIALGRA